jgi:hypothetical protein
MHAALLLLLLCAAALPQSTQPQAVIEGTGYEFPFIGAQPGRWRVWGADARGRPGAKSAWSEFFYRR